MSVQDILAWIRTGASVSGLAVGLYLVMVIGS